MTFPDPNSQFVLIGPKEVYEAVIRLDGKVTAFNEQLGHLKDDLLAVKQDHEKDMAEVKRQHERDHEKHDARLSAVEARLWPLPTVAIVLSVGSLATMIILKFV